MRNARQMNVRRATVGGLAGLGRGGSRSGTERIGAAQAASGRRRLPLLHRDRAQKGLPLCGRGDGVAGRGPAGWSCGIARHELRNRSGIDAGRDPGRSGAGRAGSPEEHMVAAGAHLAGGAGRRGRRSGPLAARGHASAAQSAPIHARSPPGAEPDWRPESRIHHRRHDRRVDRHARQP